MAFLTKKDRVAKRKQNKAVVDKITGKTRGEGHAKVCKNTDLPQKEPPRYGQPRVKKEKIAYVTGTGNSDAVSVSRNHNGNVHTTGNIVPTKFIKGKHKALANPTHKHPTVKLIWQDRNEMKTVALVTAREDRLAAKKARRNVRPIEGMVIKPEYLPHVLYQRKLAAMESTSRKTA